MTQYYLSTVPPDAPKPFRPLRALAVNACLSAYLSACLTTGIWWRERNPEVNLAWAAIAVVGAPGYWASRSVWLLLESPQRPRRTFEIGRSPAVDASV